MINRKYGMGAGQIAKYGFKLCLEVFNKYNGKCSICGDTNYLAIHHIDGKGRNYENEGLIPNNSVDNLELICRRCHCSLHSKKYWGKQAKLRGGYLWKDKEEEYKKNYRKKYYLTHREYYLNYDKRLRELKKGRYAEKKEGRE